MDTKLWNFRILTPENKFVSFKNCKIWINIEQEKYFAPIQPFIVSNLEFSLLKIEISVGIFYFFAHRSLLYSLEDSVSLHLFEDLVFYKVDKKEFHIQKKALERTKNTLLYKLQLQANLEINSNIELYKDYQLAKQKNEEARLKELFFLVKTGVDYA
ncbi:hypothetical protein DR095_00495 [Mycoplasma flocculare]|uniref:Uncharacterized protein n=1 Tax=Mesomycoplasma flocculare TaxID=2128 RepID=A0AAW9X9G5_MESFC|nr:hypothetical protein [Mesomycoplasma flocculare]MXR05793.1 hypothetical protein [Mesomycoplasma flocculare]MXR39379.1 hypothetical protein [Mycoplasma sp. MF12]MXR55884.1 hypothetical protein [Mesomycoplasma flocculare]MXR56429.1 hypothetical protein [Mesomycoplasma flocculare]